MKKRHSWIAVGKKLDAEVNVHANQQAPVLHVKMGDTLVYADVVPQGFFLTRVRAVYLNPGRFRFHVRSARVLTEVGKLLFGMQDIPVGDKRFDRRFVVQGTDVARTRALIGDPRIRELVDKQTDLNLVVRPLNRWAAYLTGDIEDIDELVFSASGVLSATRLEGVFELYREILAWLEREATAGKDEREILLARLRTRGGTVTEMGRLLWDGDAPRRVAAERLGAMGDPRAVPALIAALEDDDLETRAVSARALASLGDERAVGPLMGLLGDRKRSGGKAVAAIAAEALARLGAQGHVDAFHRALQGHDEELRAIVEGCAVPVARALTGVMEGSDLSAAEWAGKALGRIGVMEALPELRHIERTTGWDRIREACRKAIAELESMPSLPRAASPETGAADHLPRVAGAPGGDPATLPRPAPGDADESTQGGNDV